MQAMVLILAGTGITFGVYGSVALIVKADDLGAILASNASPSAWGSFVRAMGRILVKGMPRFLTFLGAIGTAAMIWVGGGIVLHGLETYGVDLVARFIREAASHAASLTPGVSKFSSWFVTALGSGIVGCIIGAALIPIAGILPPILQFLGRLRAQRA